MVASFLVTMDFGRCSKNRVMTLSVLCVGPQFPHMQYFDVCKGIWRYIKLFGSISPVCQYWKYCFLLCPTMEADMEALGASYSTFHHSHASRCHAIFSIASDASRSNEIIEHCLTLAWSFADDSDSSGWILACAFRNRFLRCINIYILIRLYTFVTHPKTCKTAYVDSN